MLATCFAGSKGHFVNFTKKGKGIKKNSSTSIVYRKLGHGPVVVLLHGFPADGTLWEQVYNNLPGFTIIVPELADRGDSVVATAEVTIAGLADMVYSILQEERVDQVVIVGHSMGGYVAAAFAEKYPAVVKGVSMVHSTTTADDEEKKASRKKVIAIIEKGGREAFIGQMVPGLFSDTFKSAHPDKVALQTSKSSQLQASTLIGFYTAMMKRKATSAILENALFPMQWILGIEDTVLPAAKVMKECSVAPINFVNLYKNCGHMSMVEEPEKLVADLGGFLNYCYGR